MKVLKYDDLFEILVELNFWIGSERADKDKVLNLIRKLRKELQEMRNE